MPQKQRLKIHIKKCIQLIISALLRKIAGRYSSCGGLAHRCLSVFAIVSP